VETEIPGPCTQFARCLVVQVGSFAVAYLAMAYRWTLDSPHYLGYRYVTTAFQWHAAVLEMWVRSDLPTSQWWHETKRIYALDFDSAAWFSGVGLCAATAVIIALLYDHLAFARHSPSGENMFHKYAIRGLGICFLVGLGLCFFSFAFDHDSWFALNCLGLGVLFLDLGFVAAPIVWLLRRILKPPRPGDGTTDVREVAKALEPGKTFEPSQYIDLKRGCFLGLNSRRKPVYIPWPTLRTTHKELLGMTGTGKGVAAGVILPQCARAGESVIVFDPKDDSIMPGVLARAAQEAGVPFTLIDLNPDRPPQVNPFQGATLDERFEMLVAGFDLFKRGTDGDYHKITEREVARRIATVTPGPFSIPAIIQEWQSLIHKARYAKRKDEVDGRGFLVDLGLLSTLVPIQTSQGPDLRAYVAQPGVTYVVGSLTDVRVVQAQKMLLFRFMQLIADRDRSTQHYVALMLDELKYLLSPQVLTMLSTVRDRKCHIMLAHQSLADFEDCITLDPKAVRGAVVENTGLKLIYRVNSPETARWASDFSGKINAYAATEQMRRAALENPGSWRETQRNLIEESTLLQLPKGDPANGIPCVGVLYGLNGPAQLIKIAPMPIGTAPAITYRFPLEEPAASMGKDLPKTAGGLPGLARAVNRESAPVPEALPHSQEGQPEPTPEVRLGPAPEDDLI